MAHRPSVVQHCILRVSHLLSSIADLFQCTCLNGVFVLHFVCARDTRSFFFFAYVHITDYSYERRT